MDETQGSFESGDYVTQTERHSGTPWAQSGSGARTTVVTTPGQDSLRDHVVAVFGSKAAAGLQPLELQLTPNIRVEGCVRVTEVLSWLCEKG